MGEPLAKEGIPKFNIGDEKEGGFSGERSSSPKAQGKELSFLKRREKVLSYGNGGDIIRQRNDRGKKNCFGGGGST